MSLRTVCIGQIYGAVVDSVRNLGPVTTYGANDTVLDGEGGYTMWGKLMLADASLRAGALPVRLAHRVKQKNDIAHGGLVRWSDVE